MGNDTKPYISSVAAGAVEGLVEGSAVEEKQLTKQAPCWPEAPIVNSR